MANAPSSDIYWQSRRVIVTGAGGFIGRHLVRSLMERGAHVSSVDRSSAVMPEGGEHVALDLSESETVDRFIREAQPECIFHLAAQADRASTPDAVQTAYRSVFLPALHVANASRLVARAPRMIFFGSCDEYGDAPVPWTEDLEPRPRTPYAFAKAAVTHMLLSMHTREGARVTVLRPSVVYGPGQRPSMFIPEAFQALSSGRPFEMTAGEQTRDFVYVADVVDTACRIAEAQDSVGAVVNVASGHVTSIRELATIIARQCDAEHLLRIGVKPYRDGEVGSYAVSIDQLRMLLRWSPPTTLTEGLARMRGSLPYEQERIA